METLVEKAKKLKKRTIMLAEADDLRVLKAAEYLKKNKVLDPVLIGDNEKIMRTAQENSLELIASRAVQVKSWNDEARQDKLFKILKHRLRHKELNDKELLKRASDPLHYAGLLTASGFADGAVAGSVATTASVIRAALATVGLAENSGIVSSIFLMKLKNGTVLTYADCGVVPVPDSNQLADIAVSSANTHKVLTDTVPAVALLSFSTRGSARHESVEKVQKAVEIANNNYPGLLLDGELQFDAAFVPGIARKKAPDSPLKGKANVFIFPDLNAANIAYKITERLAEAEATGPILQGLAKPYMDLSRGCSWQDIVNAASVAALLSDSHKEQN